MRLGEEGWRARYYKNKFDIAIEDDLGRAAHTQQYGLQRYVLCSMHTFVAESVLIQVIVLLVYLHSPADSRAGWRAHTWRACAGC